MMANDMSSVWANVLAQTIHNGKKVFPRGMETHELMSKTYVIDMRRPVLTIPERKLSYRFMVAEAYWIMCGDNKVAGIAPYNENIKKFSDDGIKFFGAYGPRVVNQIDYVINKLVEDRDTRQAGLTIWRKNPPKTKDVPCTVAMFFNIRDDKLHANVFMRSNDIWLGLPYDAFNFSMIAHWICCVYNRTPEVSCISPGSLHLTAASSHLYQTNFQDALNMLYGGFKIPGQPETPEFMFRSGSQLFNRLMRLRDSKPGDSLRWWEHASE